MTRRSAPPIRLPAERLVRRDRSLSSSVSTVPCRPKCRCAVLAQPRAELLDRPKAAHIRANLREDGLHRRSRHANHTRAVDPDDARQLSESTARAALLPAPRRAATTQSDGHEGFLPLKSSAVRAALLLDLSLYSLDYGCCKFYGIFVCILPYKEQQPSSKATIVHRIRTSIYGRTYARPSLCARSVKTSYTTRAKGMV